MSVTIPLRNDLVDFDFQVELDGQTYGFRFLWNFREEKWFGSIFDADGQPIVEGVKAVVDWPWLRRYQDSRMPPGVLQFMDTTGEQADPGLEDLGSRTLLLYFAEGEL